MRQIIELEDLRQAKPENVIRLAKSLGLPIKGKGMHEIISMVYWKLR